MQRRIMDVEKGRERERHYDDDDLFLTFEQELVWNSLRRWSSSLKCHPVNHQLLAYVCGHS
jgi:hypothetical protein